MMAAPVYHGDLYQFSQVRIEKERHKSLLLAYLLWFFFGITGVHRYYMGRINSGLMQSSMLIGIILTVFFAPILAGLLAMALSCWVLLDAVLIPFME